MTEDECRALDFGSGSGGHAVDESGGWPAIVHLLEVRICERHGLRVQVQICPHDPIHRQQRARGLPGRGTEAYEVGAWAVRRPAEGLVFLCGVISDGRTDHSQGQL